MNGRFKLEPSILISKGGAICDQAQEFQNKVNAIYSSLDVLLKSGYASEGAKVIGLSIQEKKMICWK